MTMRKTIPSLLLAGASLFGLGACEGGTVTVQWPDAARTTESFPAVAGGRFVEIRQGEGAPREIALMR